MINPISYICVKSSYFTNSILLIYENKQPQHRSNFRNFFNKYLDICVEFIVFRSDSKNNTIKLACERLGKYVNRKKNS